MPSPQETVPSPDQQDRIKRWFDRTYEEKGFSYLRPVEAYAVFLSLLAVQRGESLLDIACGPGLLLECAVKRGVRPSGIDLSAVAVRRARERLPDLPIHEANAEKLPFEDAAFDCITCLGSLERMLHREKALAEMRRVLKPGGRLCLMVRNARSLSWRLTRLLGRQNREGHQDAATQAEWRSLLSEAGFRIEAVHPDQWPLMWRERLLRRLGRRTAFDRIHRGFLPLDYANEFIFITRLPDPHDG